MEKLLEKLFEYQRFDPSSKLSRLIEETEERLGSALSDEDIECVNAAGELPIPPYAPHKEI